MSEETDTETLSISPSAATCGSVKRRLSPAATSVIELSYNGDYPGYPIVRLNGRWLTDEQNSFLMSLFPPCESTKEGRHGLRAFFDYCGAKMIPGSLEHARFEGTLTISISQNDRISQPEGETK